MFLFDAHGHLPGPGGGTPSHPQVVCGTRESDWEAVLAHAATHPEALPMVGLHPWFALEAAPGWEARLDSLLAAHRAGVGECGLDFARASADREAQVDTLRTQLKLAQRHHRPVALHVVRAWGPLLDLLEEEGVPEAGVMVHAFGGSPETAARLQALGVFLSFSAEGLAPDRTTGIAALRAVGPGHLLVETDGRGGLSEALDRAAGHRGVAVEDLARRTWKNGQRCFRELRP